MRMLDKLLGVSTDRRSRFHSRRGRLLPAREIVRAPELLVGRLRRSFAEPEPWMASGAVAELDRLLRPHMTLLELGSGTSTVWYAKRTKSTTSIEDHAEWADQVTVMVMDLPNVDLRRVASMSEGLDTLAGDQFDVVIVDHTDTPELTRVDAIRALKDRVGIVVLDDSDRVAYLEADAVLAGWSRKRFVSLRATPFQATETTIYRRPADGETVVGPAV